MRSEYDFSKGVRGKHAAKYAEGANARSARVIAKTVSRYTMSSLEHRGAGSIRACGGLAYRAAKMRS